MQYRKYTALVSNRPTIGACRDQFFLLTTAIADGTLQYSQYSTYLKIAHFTVFAAIEARANFCLWYNLYL